MSPENNFKQMIFIENIPEVQVAAIQNLLNEKIKQHKIKILIPELDVYIASDMNELSSGYVIILYDGFKPLDQKDLEEQ